MEKTRRTQIRAAVFGLVLAFIGLVMMVNPFVLDLEELGFAIAFFGILVLTAGITTFVMYAGRARTMGNLMRDEGELVHWQYDALLWRQYVEAEFKEDSSAKTMLFLVGSGFALVIGIIFAVADPDVAVFMLLMMLSLIVLMGFLAIVVPRVNNAIYKSHPGEAVITMRTLYIGGRLHTWGMLGFGLEGAILQKGPWDYIEIAYSYPSSPTPQIEVVRVPVPPGGEEEAQRVVSQLLGQMVAPPAG